MIQYVTNEQLMKEMQDVVYYHITEDKKYIKYGTYDSTTKKTSSLKTTEFDKNLEALLLYKMEQILKIKKDKGNPNVLNVYYDGFYNSDGKTLKVFTYPMSFLENLYAIKFKQEEYNKDSKDLTLYDEPFNITNKNSNKTAYNSSRFVKRVTIAGLTIGVLALATVGSYVGVKLANKDEYNGQKTTINNMYAAAKDNVIRDINDKNVFMELSAELADEINEKLGYPAVFQDPKVAESMIALLNNHYEYFSDLDYTEEQLEDLSRVVQLNLLLISEYNIGRTGDDYVSFSERIVFDRRMQEAYKEAEAPILSYYSRNMSAEEFAVGLKENIIEIPKNSAFQMLNQDIGLRYFIVAAYRGPTAKETSSFYLPHGVQEIDDGFDLKGEPRIMKVGPLDDSNDTLIGNYHEMLSDTGETLLGIFKTCAKTEDVTPPSK